MPNDVAISSIVVAIQGRPLSTDTPSTGDALVWNGSEWEPTLLPSSLPPDGYAGGDLGGSYPNPNVVAIQGIDVSNTAPSINQVLEYNGTEYVPTNLPTSLPPSGTASGDLTGSYPNPTVSGIQGVAVSPTSPSTNQFLKYNGSTYAPASLPTSLPPSGSAGGDLGGTYPNPTVLSVAHITTGVLPAANQAAQTMGGDVSGTTSSATVAKIQGNPVSSETLGASEDGYVFTWVNADGYWAARPKAVCGAYCVSTQYINATTQITNWVVKFDNMSGFSTTNSNYIIPSTGYYHIDAQLLLSGTLGANAGVWLTAYLNGTATHDSGLSLVGNAYSQVQVSYGTVIFATVGQALDLRMTTGGSTGLTIEGGNANFNYFNIHQI